MKSLLRNIATLAAVTIATLCSCAAAENYCIPIGDFKELNVTDNVNVVYRCMPDSAGFARFTGDKEFDDAFIFSNNGKGKLRIQVNSEDVDKPGLPTLYVYSTQLNKVENGSNKNIAVECIKKVPDFKAKLIGNGKIEVQGLDCDKVEAVVEAGNGCIVINGAATNAVYTMIGAGVIQADGLKAKNVKCRILGAGEIGCDATDLLSTQGIGSTRIYYIGNPAKVKKSGGGKLIAMKK